MYYTMIVPHFPAADNQVSAKPPFQTYKKAAGDGFESVSPAAAFMHFSVQLI